MKALVLSRYRNLELLDVPEPQAGADEVLVRVAACGICGSDVHGYDGASGRRIPPIVMGHEAAGVVAGVGSMSTSIAIGDRVTFDSTVYCGRCSYCQAGQVNLCDQREVLGVSCTEYRRAGAFAEYVIVPKQIVHRLPDSMSFVEAAMLEAASVALHAVSLSGASQGTSAVVVGAGMIGLLTFQALTAAGCSQVIIVDPDASRLGRATEVGATVTMHGAADEAVSEVDRRTNGAGVDIVVDAVGIHTTVSAAISCVRKGGAVILVGNISPEVPLPLQKVVTRQIRVQGSCASSGEYPRAIEMIANGTIKVRPLITAVAPLDEGPRWFDRLYAREPNLMKVVLTPGNVK